MHRVHVRRPSTVWHRFSTDQACSGRRPSQPFGYGGRLEATLSAGEGVLTFCGGWPLLRAFLFWGAAL